MNSPLHARRILLTRPEPQASLFAERLRTLGALVDCFAGVRIRINHPPPAELAALSTADLIFFVSRNAVQGLQACDGFTACRTAALAAIGKATAQALDEIGHTPSMQAPSPYNSEALLRLDALRDLDGRHVVIVRGQDGRETLAEELRQRGASVDYLCAYHRAPPENTLSFKCLPHGVPDALCITSVEIARNLKQCIASEEYSMLLEQALVAGNSRIADACAKLGYTHVAMIANNPRDDAMLAALLDYFPA